MFREFGKVILGTAALVGLAMAGLLACLQPVHGEQQAPELSELRFELPEPYFGGTPMDWSDPNLEEETYKPHPPIIAPVDTRVISRGKPVTSSGTPNCGKLEQVTDGIKDHDEKHRLELPEGLQWVQIDLQDEFEIYCILIWHSHHGVSVYFDVIGHLSNDPEFKKDYIQFYNSDVDNSSGLGAGKDKLYMEYSKGRLFDLKGQQGRYIRFYSRGNVRNDKNHVVEIEVWESLSTRQRILN